MGSIHRFPGLDPDDVAVGTRLKQWRRERGVGTDALAKALSLSPEQIRLAEAGRAHLNSLQIAAATACLHLPVWALMSDTPTY
ncbi:XRE family transcriptional regulator [uncultured Brevundimonas sp.]|uniref:helix-turn-helix domain-containing protein n=1 Tax=uncultured Brevundimonas sp. TaxID=213418 RepID=UPI0030EB459E|tara:strand:- start:13478 stop:13726 length:249 start_codon:yes stop_codon:yes gene_type:complete